MAYVEIVTRSDIIRRSWRNAGGFNAIGRAGKGETPGQRTSVSDRKEKKRLIGELMTARMVVPTRPNASWKMANWTKIARSTSGCMVMEGKCYC